MSGAPQRSADWYRDPQTPGQLRYWTGTAWSDQTSPMPQQTISTVPLGTNHGLHLILTLVTCGAWLPIWLIVWLSRRGQSRVIVS